MAADFVFLHGSMQGGWVWDEAIAALCRLGGDAVGRCLALDVPGCGAKRGRDTSGMSFAALVDDLASDIDAAQVSDAVLVGHSQAGSVLPSLVAARPGRFRGVIAIACIVPPPGANALAGTAGSRLRTGEAPDPAVMMGHLRDMFCSDMDAAGADRFMALVGADAWPRASYGETDWQYDHLAAIDVAYVLCEEDRCVPPARQEDFARRLHARRVHRIAAGHQLMVTQPDALAELLLAQAAR